MPAHRPHRRRATTAAGIASAIIVAAAAVIGPAPLAAGESWQTLLAAQLLEERRCELNRILTERRVPLGNKVTYDGRIQCVDGREFDFAQPKPDQRFIIKLCQPAVC